IGRARRQPLFAAIPVKNDDAIVGRLGLRLEVQVQPRTDELRRGDADLVLVAGQAVDVEFAILEVLALDQFRIVGSMPDGECELRYHCSVRSNHDTPHRMCRGCIRKRYPQADQTAESEGRFRDLHALAESMQRTFYETGLPRSTKMGTS